MLHFISFLLFLSASVSLHAADPVRCPEFPTTRMVVREGEYVQAKGVSYKLSQFVADLIPRSKELPGCLSKVTRIQQGVVRVSADSLSAMFARKMANGGDSKISDLEIEMEEGQVVIKGKAKKLIPIPFELKGPVDVVQGSKLRLHAKEVKAVGIPAKGLLEMLGFRIAEMVEGNTAGLTATEDAIIFDPAKLANIQGTIRNLRVLSDGLLIEFANPPQPAKTARR